jgi:hypothetical protein
LTRSCRRLSNCFALRNLYSITSSALSRIDCGTISPSDLAVLRLTAISNFVANLFAAEVWGQRWTCGGQPFIPLIRSLDLPLKL